MLFYEKTEAEGVIIEFVLKAVEWMGTRGFTPFIQASLGFFHLSCLAFKNCKSSQWSDSRRGEDYGLIKNEVRARMGVCNGFKKIEQ